jgi:ParB family chromosome partitioning protein
MDQSSAVGVLTLDLHRLELRYASLRLPDPPAITRLARSIAADGQLVPCIAVAGEGQALILVDGYRRIAAAAAFPRARPGRGRVLAGGPRAGAVGRVGAYAQPIVRADRRSLPVARVDFRRVVEPTRSRPALRARCELGQSPPATARGLSDALLEAVRQGQVSTWAAVRILGPLARANSAHAERLLATLRQTPLSTRQLANWFAQYQRAARPVRERMVESPKLLLEAVAARQEEQVAGQRLRAGPEGEVLADVRILEAVGTRLKRRLSALSSSATPLPPVVRTAVAALQPALESLQRHLTRICPHDIQRDSSIRPDAASARPGDTRDQSALESLA